MSDPLAPVHAFRVPIYGGMLRLHTSRDAFAADRATLTDAQIPPPGDGRVCMIFGTSTGVTYLVGWFDGRLSTLSHELTHVAVFALVRAGINTSDSNGEALCHLQGELMTLCGADEYEMPLAQPSQ